MGRASRGIKAAPAPTAAAMRTKSQRRQQHRLDVRPGVDDDMLVRAQQLSQEEPRPSMLTLTRNPSGLQMDDVAGTVDRAP